MISCGTNLIQVASSVGGGKIKEGSIPPDILYLK